jgi:hypothetical protein
VLRAFADQRQLSLALNVAVFALVVLYFIHSLIFLFPSPG